MRRFLQGFVCAVVLAILAILVLIFSGRYDVSARTPQVALLHWLLDVTRARSVDVHSAAQDAPDLAQADLQNGFRHYRETCALCHGAPGKDRSDVAKGLQPQPPAYTEIGRLPPTKLLWIVTNGIKMTGMPAFGPTHTDAQLRDIVAFVKKLPGMTVDAYDAMAVQAPAEAPAQPSAQTPGQGIPQTPAETPAVTPPAASGQ